MRRNGAFAKNHFDGCAPLTIDQLKDRIEGCACGERTFWLYCRLSDNPHRFRLSVLTTSPIPIVNVYEPAEATFLNEAWKARTSSCEACLPSKFIHRHSRPGCSCPRSGTGVTIHHSDRHSGRECVAQVSPIHWRRIGLSPSRTSSDNFESHNFFSARATGGAHNFPSD